MAGGLAALINLLSNSEHIIQFHALSSLLKFSVHGIEYYITIASRLTSKTEQCSEAMVQAKGVSYLIKYLEQNHDQKKEHTLRVLLNMSSFESKL